MRPEMLLTALLAGLLETRAIRAWSAMPTALAVTWPAMGAWALRSALLGLMKTDDARWIKDRAAAAATRCDAQAKARAGLRRQRGLEPFVAPPVPEEDRRAATTYREWREAQTKAHRAQLVRDVKAAAKSGQGGGGGDDGGGRRRCRSQRPGHGRWGRGRYKRRH